MSFCIYFTVHICEMIAWIDEELERDIVVEVVRCGYFRGRVLLRLPAGIADTLIRTPSAQQLDIVNEDLHAASGLSILFPAILSQLTLDTDLFSLDQVLRQSFRSFSNQDAVEKMAFLLPGVLFLDSSVHRQREVRDGET